MPNFVILVTSDSDLAEAWRRQLPPSLDAFLFSDPNLLPLTANKSFRSVVLLDIASEDLLPSALSRHPTILVGEPRSLPFEQSRLQQRAKAYLSYQESRNRLHEILPLFQELAEQQSVIELLTERNLRNPAPRGERNIPHADASDLWDFLEGAIENLDSRDRLISEFRRASRQLLRASHSVFFIREADGFRADRGTSFFPADDPLVSYFENHPTLVDGANWDGPAEPVAELAIRSRLALWGARLLAPIHDNGRLLGLVAFGVRDDGQPYDESCRTRAIHFARLFRHFLTKSGQLGRLSHQAEKLSLGTKYLPGTIVLAREELEPRHLPLIVRDLIGQVRRSGEVCRVAPFADQPFRASAGVIAETGGIWATWQEASSELHDATAREQAGRREILRELALTLNHELGNALVSLTTFRHAEIGRSIPAPLVETVKGDVSNLETLNNNLALMQSFHEQGASIVDMRDIAASIGNSLGIKVETGPDPVMLSVSKKLLDFSLSAIIQTVGENRPEHGLRDLALVVRSTGAGPELTTLLSLKGKRLELEGVLPEPVENAVPNQGRLSVFLAKEIIRLHRGEIHAGPGIEGTEILISIRRW